MRKVCFTWSGGAALDVPYRFQCLSFGSVSRK